MRYLNIFIFSLLCSGTFGQHAASTEFSPNILPVRGFCIEAPRTGEVDKFTEFIENELASRSVNTLILRVDYNYRYKSHPELAEENGLSKSDVRKIVGVCRRHDIRIIPQVNLLGHQSWASRTGALLREYPQFDETPKVTMPEKYVWPNADGLYCKSYCPLHPDVHKVVFEIIDELCEIFEAEAFHAGMDEVFYIGEKQCPRCSGMDKAELFAGEVRTIRDHLAMNNRQLWIWGDRLIDGKTTGIGEWEGSYNNTYRAVDMIPKDVIICDWHYERAEQTAVYFAMKGFGVVSCPKSNAAAAVQQARDMVRFRSSSAGAMKGRFLGVVQTVWSGAGKFLDLYYGKAGVPASENTAECFRQLYTEIKKIAEN